MKWMLSFTLLLTTLSDVRAWGPEGHMIVGEIAEHQLTTQAKNAVKKLIPGSSLADVSTWADTIKGQSEWSRTKGWHFVNLEDGQSYESIHHEASGDVITAIQDQIDVLRSGSTSQLQKQNALKFLVHFVGDIHQPLHAGRHSDQGGNQVRVSFEGWMVNLHQLWDSTMITKQNLDYKQYANFLEGRTGYSAPSQSPNFPFKEVITEDIAVRKQIYDFGGKASPVQLDRAYMNKNLETLNNRLLMGGKRLAAILNSIFK